MVEEVVFVETDCKREMVREEREEERRVPKRLEFVHLEGVEEIREASDLEERKGFKLSDVLEEAKVKGSFRERVAEAMAGGGEEESMTIERGKETVKQEGRGENSTGNK